MSLLASALKALATQQAFQATRQTVGDSLWAVALLPVGIGTLLIAIAFGGYAWFSALVPDVSNAMAASIVAIGMLVITAVIGLIAWWFVDRPKTNLPDVVEGAEEQIEPLAELVDKITEEVQENPGSTVMMATLAGAIAYLFFANRRR